ncbi:MAG: SDR family oxidoreductase [Pseudooceanicola sp.]|nr:SDR family oxidoreductase [Pseudooceanicola sp.]
MSIPAHFPDLADASVFVTGGGSGIGAALVEGFVAQGARVAFGDIRDASGFAAALGERHPNAPLFLPCDITDTEALRRTLAQAAEAHGPISVLVNNAANDDRHALGAVTPDYWDAMMAVNLKAYFFACQAVAPGMAAAGRGAIVNFSSISYIMGNAGYPVYTAANAAITGMTRSLARELGPQGVRVNAVAPGWVLTEKQKALWATPEGLAEHLARQCLPEHLAPEDIVAPVLFLASQASRMITGQCLAVDGGVVVSG